MKKTGLAKMTVPLKIEIANLIKAKTSFLVGDDGFKVSYLAYNDEGEVTYDRLVYDDTDILIVGKGKKGEKAGRWSFNKFKPSKPEEEDMMGIEVKDNQFVFIKVAYPHFEAEANLVAKLIETKLKVKPSVTLFRG